MLDAVEVVMESVFELCAVVPASGVPLNTRLSSEAAAVLLALLPPELQPNLMTTAHLPVDDSKQVGVQGTRLNRSERYRFGTRGT